MKKNSNKTIIDTYEFASGDHVNKDIEIFKSNLMDLSLILKILSILIILITGYAISRNIDISSSEWNCDLTKC